MAPTQQRTICLLLAASLVAANMLDVTEENYDTITAGKNVFIMFYEPGSESCKRILPDFEKMAIDFKDHDVVLIGQVDCASETVFCEDFDIKLYPTFYFGDPSAPEVYDGERDYESMINFAEENLTQELCSVNNIDVCSPEQKKVIDEFKQKSPKELDDMADEIERQAKLDEDAFEKAVQELQDQYKNLVDDYNDKIEKLNQQTHYRLLKSVTLLKESLQEQGKTFEEL
mmetsp:Transcript_2184/g.3334  ORF Transcript_2184/g.3334 Transcript_2184/m.3334 type:complete len:229 (+) Transcript_2184:57-743(+)